MTTVARVGTWADIDFAKCDNLPLVSTGTDRLTAVTVPATSIRPDSAPLNGDTSKDHDDEPIWRRKRREFWKCGPKSVWRSPVMISWYIVVALLVIGLIYQHYGERGNAYRHEITVATAEYFEAHEVIFPVRSLVHVAAVKSGWMDKEEQETMERLLTKGKDEPAPFEQIPIEYGSHLADWDVPPLELLKPKTATG